MRISEEGGGLHILVFGLPAAPATNWVTERYSPHPSRRLKDEDFPPLGTAQCRKSPASPSTSLLRRPDGQLMAGVTNDLVLQCYLVPSVISPISEVTINL